MEPYTLNRDYQKVDIIDNFTSLIWTERYYGDSGVEMVVPSTPEMIDKLPEGIFLGIPESDELMILETEEDQSGNLKVTGQSVLSWLNNRFIRATPNHADRYWNIAGSPGYLLWVIVEVMCCSHVYQGVPIDMGIGTSAQQAQLLIPGLEAISYDSSLPAIEVAVPYGPIYDALKQLATTYQLGMKISMVPRWDSTYTTGSDTGYPNRPPGNQNPNSYQLGFRSYKGLDRTSNQPIPDTVNLPGGTTPSQAGSSTRQWNPIVRFSPDTDSLTDIKELRSIAAFKTRAYAFAPDYPDIDSQPVHCDPGEEITSPSNGGFDLRAQLVFADQLSTDVIGGDMVVLHNILDDRARAAVAENAAIRAVDGEVMPDNPYTYGIHYSLGDLVEIQGNSGIVKTGRVTEYIRTHDATGEKGYPTIEMVE
jgi:Siphovirus ReqiPepy6 Gp37-like protein